MAHPTDAWLSPATAIALGRLGGLGVLDARGAVDPVRGPDAAARRSCADARRASAATRRLQEVYAEPIKPELIAERVEEIRDAGVTVAVRVSPQHTLALAQAVIDAGRRHPGHPAAPRSPPSTSPAGTSR